MRQQLNGLKSEMSSVKSKIHTAKVKEGQITETIEQVNERISVTQGRLARTNARIDRLENEHDMTVNRLQETELRLQKRRGLLAERIRETYRRGDTNYLHVLLQARTMHDLMARNHYVRLIVRSDAELIDGVKSDIVQIRVDKKKLERQAREQQSLAAEYESDRAQYQQDRATQSQLLNKVKVQRHQAEAELDVLEEEAAAMTSRIRALSEMLKRRQEALRRERERLRRMAIARAKAAARAGKKPPPIPKMPEEPPPAWHGGFIRPVNGSQTSGFGYRYHPILHRRKLHTGVDFGARTGTPIRAAAGGVVLLASYSRGYGNCVIIDHGGGTTTLYGHCSALLVSEGQTVRQGQTIARVGSTGMSTGPHLHFEVRRNGVPVRPF